MPTFKMYDENPSVVMPESLEKTHAVLKMQRFCVDTVHTHSTAIRRGVVLFCLFGYIIYLGFAIRHSVEKATPLLIITGSVVVILLYVVMRDSYGEVIYKAACEPIGGWMNSRWARISW